MTSLFRHRPTPLRLDPISELPEDFPSPFSPRMNLGIESPASVFRPSITPISADSSSLDEWAKVGLVVNSHVPARRRSWRSLSWVAGNHPGFRSFQHEQVDKDCAICFDPAINPRKTSCCSQVFCYAHLADWLKSNKNCPACNSKCISPISPSQSSTHLPTISKILPSVSHEQLGSSSSEDWPDRSTQSTPSIAMQDYPPSPLHYTQYLESSLQKTLPAFSTTQRIVGEEIGKLLMLIALILVLCVIASPQ